MTTSTHAHYVAAQARTLVTADNHGERWTRADVDFIVENTDTMRDEDLATALGRTLAAIWNMQHRITHEGACGVIASLEAPRQRAGVDLDAVRPLSQRTYTFIGDDVPPGWND